MRIERIFNNNIVSTISEDAHELLILGKGIGFNSKVGDSINESKIEKIFQLKDDTIDKFKMIVNEIPSHFLELTDDIVQLFKKRTTKNISDVIYISLSDHLYFTMQRLLENVVIENPLSWEVRRFYQEEYTIAKEAAEIVENRLNIKLPDPEVSNIALHFVNAEVNSDMNDVTHIMQLMQGIISIIKYHFNVDFDEESTNYYRFMTHLKFFCQRVIIGESNDETEEFLYQMVKKNHASIFECIAKIERYLENNYHFTMSHSEQFYLALHLERLLKRKNNK
ncbi:BglG family transcription antiterminator LicT [Listeria grayi]|uniref:BglG family transcription antiterminator LicT n=1 Tax=Listeria grayi TaxID=1641 RepID=UPI00162897A8|nr:PRD domain-containing protein [Listeria grayi]MBC1922194.1 PRD domain-containing protein [Listeria grayi]